MSGDSDFRDLPPCPYCGDTTYSLHCAMCGSHFNPDLVPVNTLGRPVWDTVKLLCKNPDDEGICAECYERRIFPAARKLKE